MPSLNFSSLACCFTLLWLELALAQTAFPQTSDQAQIRVGTDQGDIRGNDYRALQAAIDYAASLGGGTVSIGPGRYLMRNALTLRSRVNVIGVPGQTVLVACDLNPAHEAHLKAASDSIK